jgi:hypothetical protein
MVYVMVSSRHRYTTRNDSPLYGGGNPATDTPYL